MESSCLISRTSFSFDVPPDQEVVCMYSLVMTMN